MLRTKLNSPPERRRIPHAMSMLGLLDAPAQVEHEGIALPLARAVRLMHADALELQAAGIAKAVDDFRGALHILEGTDALNRAGNRLLPVGTTKTICTAKCFGMQVILMRRVFGEREI